MNETISMMPTALIVPSTTNPRKSFSQNDETELEADIKTHGIVFPLDVRSPEPAEVQTRHDTGEFYVLVDGERRLRVAKHLGLVEVPVILHPTMSASQAETVQLISFTQRKDLEPMDEAQALGRLASRGKSPKEISLLTGKSIRYIVQRCELTHLIDKAVEALKDGKLPVTFALEICRLQAKSQVKLLKFCLHQNPTYIDLVEGIRRDEFSDLKSAPFETLDLLLVRSAGSCLTCRKRTGNAPDLFETEKNPQTCTDPACYTEKVRAHIAAVLEKNTIDDLPVVKISSEYYATGQGGMNREKYSQVPKKDATHIGIFVDGDPEEFGHTVPIAVKGSEKSKGKPGVEHHLSPEEARRRYKRRLEIFSNKIEMHTRAELLKKAIPRVKWPLDRKELQLLPAELIRHWGQAFHAQSLEPVFALMNVKLPKNPCGFEDWVTKICKKLSDQQLAQLTVGLVLSDELIQDPSYIQPTEKFDAVLEAHKDVNRKSIHTEMEKMLAPKKPKPFKAPKVEKPKARKTKKTKKAKK